jgi:A/G-specific adenine glycosylase
MRQLNNLRNNLLFTSFGSVLLRWHQHKNTRQMPWKGIKDPYKIWLSEVILQQTKVEQGEKYYNLFIHKYPFLKDLANANEEELFRLWQGLGYYNRCRNLLQTAKQIMQDFDGQFPNKYLTILSLKGIGEYTAAAISSFAFDLPHAVVDGNVVRVLSRVFLVDENFHVSNGKKLFQQLAQQLLVRKKAALYNQAIMDLGATICKPKNPSCTICPFRAHCGAYQQVRIHDFPIKKVKNPITVRHFHYFIFENRQHIWITKRSKMDIWKDLFELPMVEQQRIARNSLPFNLLKSDLLFIEQQTQLLSHQKIVGNFYKIPTEKVKKIDLKSLLKVKKSELNQFAFPRLIISFLQNNKYL